MSLSRCSARNSSTAGVRIAKPTFFFFIPWAFYSLRYQDGVISPFTSGLAPRDPGLQTLPGLGACVPLRASGGVI